MIGDSSFYVVGSDGVIMQYRINSVIPVEINSFTSSISDNSVTIYWQTATETNNSGFQIERFKDSKIKALQDLPAGLIGWESIAFVNGNGTTTEPKSYSYTDMNLEPGIYQYRLKQIDYDGTFEYSNIIETEIKFPIKFSLEQNYPNPFNPSTVISYRLPVTSNVTLKVYDVLGNEIATLVNEQKQPGTYEVTFDSHSGLSGIKELPSGIYFYQLRVSDLGSKKEKNNFYTETKKMLLIK